jgi:hypothetical protein
MITVHKEIKVECRSCGSTGVYSGFCEPKGTAVVCGTCGGSGCETIRYKPFEKRRRRRGIKTVSQSRGSFIATGVGAVGKSISYADFLKIKIDPDAFASAIFDEVEEDE